MTNPVNALLDRTYGTCTIIDKDPLPELYVNDVQITTSGPAALVAVFTVAFDRPSGTTVTVQYTTTDGTAHAGFDFTAQTGTLTFAPGVTTQQVSVAVLTPAVYTPNETFYLDLFNPSRALLGDPRGAATFVYSTPPFNNQIIDDGDDGYSQTTGWTNVTNLLAYGLDYDYHAAGNGSGSATWEFDNLPAGSYQVFTKWIGFSNRASNAPYTIFDGSTALGTVPVNQQVMPSGDQSNGVVWQSLGTFSTSTGTLAVKLGDNANGYVVADAVRIVLNGIAEQQPEMDVAGLASVATGDDTPSIDEGTDFGTVYADTNSVSQTFTISNNGNAPLHLTGSPRVAIGGDDPQDFSVTAQPAATVAPGTTTTFTVMFHATAPGVRTAVVSIANDDDDEHPYTFTVGGVGADPGETLFVEDDSDDGFSAVGGWTSSANASAQSGEFLSDAAGSGSDKATWSFAGLAPGTYTVYATWVPAADRATNAPFTVADGAVSQVTVAVNQQQAPSGRSDAGLEWTSLETLYVTSGTLTVSLANNANGRVIADAIELVREDLASLTPPPAPPFAAIAHNAVMAPDVNADSIVSAMDALIVINHLMNSGVSTSQSATANALTAMPAAGTSSPASSGQTRPYYMDVNGDGIISPIDALTVINYLLHPAATGASGPSAAAAVTPTAMAPADAGAPSPAAAASALVPQAVDAAMLGLASPSPAETPPAAATPSTVSTDQPPAVAATTQSPASVPLASTALKPTSASSERVSGAADESEELTDSV